MKIAYSISKTSKNTIGYQWNAKRRYK